mmetsp:Transcript_28848/g.67440  ORF Transcript_28848/g.67440 Transcript_28848/m.67440 type:complete len:125 (-) Transcript_28848:23-397(-)
MRARSGGFQFGGKASGGLGRGRVAPKPPTPPLSHSTLIFNTPTPAAASASTRHALLGQLLPVAAQLGAMEPAQQGLQLESARRVSCSGGEAQARRRGWRGVRLRRAAAVAGAPNTDASCGAGSD